MGSLTVILGTLNLIIKFWDEVQVFVQMREAGQLTDWISQQKQIQANIEGAKTDEDRASLAKQLSDSTQSMP